MERESKILGLGYSNLEGGGSVYSDRIIEALRALLEPLRYLIHFLANAEDEESGGMHYHSNELLIKINYQFLSTILKDKLGTIAIRADKELHDILSWTKEDGTTTYLFDRMDTTHEEDFSKLISHRLHKDPWLDECRKLEQLVHRRLMEQALPKAQLALQESIDAIDIAIAAVASEMPFNLEHRLMQSFDVNDKENYHKCNIWKARSIIEFVTNGKDDAKYPYTVMAMILAANQVIGNNIKKISYNQELLNELAVMNARSFIECRNYIAHVPNGLEQFRDLQRGYFDHKYVGPCQRLHVVLIGQAPEKKVEPAMEVYRAARVRLTTRNYKAAHSFLFNELKTLDIIKWKHNKKVQLLEEGKIFSDQDLLYILAGLLQPQLHEQLFCEVLDNIDHYTGTSVTNIINTPIEYWNEGDSIGLVKGVQKRIVQYVPSARSNFFAITELRVVVNDEVICPGLRYVYLLELAMCSSQYSPTRYITKLLDFDAITTIDVFTRNGLKPLLHAVGTISQMDDMLNLLLSYGSDPNLKNIYGVPLLYLMAQIPRSKEDIALIINYGADPRQTMDLNEFNCNVLYGIVLSGLDDNKASRVMIDIIILTIDKYGFNAVKALLQSTVKVSYPSGEVIERSFEHQMAGAPDFARQKCKRIFNILSALSKSECHELFKVILTNNRGSISTFLEGKTLDEKKALFFGPDLSCTVLLDAKHESNLGKWFLHDRVSKVENLISTLKAQGIKARTLDDGIKHVSYKSDTKAWIVQPRNILLNIISFARFFCEDETVAFIISERDTIRAMESINDGGVKGPVVAPNNVVHVEVRMADFFDLVIAEVAKIASEKRANDVYNHASVEPLALVTLPKLMVPPTQATISPTSYKSLSPTIAPTTIVAPQQLYRSAVQAIAHNHNVVGRNVEHHDLLGRPEDIRKDYILRYELHNTNVLFQILDFIIAGDKLRYEPTLNNLNTAIVKAAHIWCLCYKINDFPVMIGLAAMAVKEQFIQGEYLQVFTTLITIASNMLLPLVLWNNVPLGLILSTFIISINVCSVVTNLDDLYQLQYSTTIGATMRSLTAFMGLADKLADTSLKFVYDFKKSAEEYERQINDLNLLLESMKLDQTLGEAENIMATKHVSIMSDKYSYKHCVQILRVGSADVDSCHYNCYNTDLQLIDRVIVIGDVVQAVEHL